MNKLFMFFAIFSIGYLCNDLMRASKIDFIDQADAEVAGMSHWDLKYDYDFKRAVRDIVEDCTSDSDGYIYC